jgi:hypothetical protein
MNPVMLLLLVVVMEPGLPAAPVTLVVPLVLLAVTPAAAPGLLAVTRSTSSCCSTRPCCTGL